MRKHIFKSSSTIYSTSYDEKSEMLTVTLHPLKGSEDQRTYGYSGVSLQTFEQFISASSPGAFYNRTIRALHKSLGETQPLTPKPTDSTYLTEEDFDFMINDIEAGFRKQSSEDIFNELLQMEEDDSHEIKPEIVPSGKPLPPTVSGMYVPDAEIESYLEQSLSYRERAFGVTIEDSKTLLYAEELFAAGKATQKAISDYIVPITKSHYDSWKAAKDNENKVLKPIEEGTDRLGKAIYAYRKDLERREAVERQKAAEEAYAAAEAERKRQTEELKKRLAAESPEHAGEIMASPEIQAPPVMIFTPRQDIIPPKTSGVTTRDNWVAVVENVEDLILHVAEGIKRKRDGQSVVGFASPECLEPNLSALKSLAKVSKDRLSIPGVRAENQGAAVATRRK